MRSSRQDRIRGWLVAAATMTVLVSISSTSASGMAEPEGPSVTDEEEADGVSAQQDVRPQLPSPVSFALQPDQASAPASAEAVEQQVEQAWQSGRLGDRDDRAIVVQDALTGDVLVDLSGEKPLTPASLTKLLSAAAIMAVLPPQHTFSTRVVRGPTARDIVLVAGGDQLLSAGQGSPTAVAGRAGLEDLAQQTVTALGARDEAGGEVRVWLDSSYAHGPSRAPGWTDFWVDNGFAGRITMLGLEQSRALPYDPSPPDPAMVAAQSFRTSLTSAGLDVASGPIERVDSDTQATPEAGEPVGVDPQAGSSASQPASMPVLAEVESAPLRDVLALALATSDNAMIEQLSRQGALATGAQTDQDSVNAWVLATLRDSYGIDTSSARLADTSGLSDGTQVPMQMISQTLVAGTSGRHPALQSTLSGLPIAGLTGTLTDRFAAASATQGRGVVRAKTGSLPQVTSLAGTLSTKDGRMLVFALSSNDVDSGAAGSEATVVIDDLVADLAACGC